MGQPLLKNGVDLLDGLQKFIADSKRLHLFVPYVKLVGLQHLLESTDCCELIVVRWEFRDLVLGASDLKVFEFCLEKGISLYRNPRIHLKAFVDDYRRCFFGSANISGRALNFPKSERFNYELATVIQDLALDDAFYFHRIIAESTLITEDIYGRLRASVIEATQPQIEAPQLEEFDYSTSSGEFLISSLPMSRSVETLIQVYKSGEASDHQDFNCALHDLALYDIPLGLDVQSFRERLAISFFVHPFIKAFLSNLGQSGYIYFGRAKEWIQNNCADVPIPRMWELTSNTRILYDWILDLGGERYRVDIPGQRSERLTLIN